MPRRFARLEPVPDHARIEAETLARWDRDRVFERLREQNADGPTFSFIDGPVTANKVMGVHTAWGRTLKDVFQRYQALRGRHQRYQNGWDCQGLWIEVGVEKSLGLNSKREIEEYGLERFAARCREVVAWSSDELRRASQRLGHVDGLGARLLHVQRHQHRVHLALPARGARPRLAVSRAPLHRVVPALRHVALAARALAGGRAPAARGFLALRAPPVPRAAGRGAGGVDDDAVDAPGQRGRRRRSRARVRAAGLGRLGGGRVAAGCDLRGAGDGERARRPPLPRAVRRPRARRAGRAPRDPVGRRGARHWHRDRPHRARRRPRGLRAREGPRPAGAHAGRRERALLSRLRVAGGDEHRGGRGADRRRPARARRAGRRGHGGARVSALLALRHAADLPRRRRLVHRRGGRAAADARGERAHRVDAAAVRQAHGGLAAQHGGLEHLPAALLRPAAAVLPVRLRLLERDRLARGARGARRVRARRPAGAAPAVDRRGGDPLRALRRRRAPDPGGRRRVAGRRHRALLDPGLAEPGVRRGRQRDRRGRRPHPCRPARPRDLGAVVPGRLGDRDARADPAVVLLAVLHVGGADRPCALPQGAHLREAARRRGARDARLVGQPDRRRRGVRPHGRRRHALALLPAAAGAEHPLRLRGSRRGQAPAAHVVELRALLRRLRAHRGLRAAPARSGDGRDRTSSCARWTAGCRHGRSS